MKRVRDGRDHSRSASGFRQESSRKDRTGFHCRPGRGFLPGHERQGRPFQHAAKEAGLRRGASVVRRLRGRTLQRGRGGGVVAEAGRVCHIKQS
jgi:hypothetical protein